MIIKNNNILQLYNINVHKLNNKNNEIVLNKKYCYLILFSFLYLFSTPIFAFGVDMPASNDLSVQILAEIFGSIVDGQGNDAGLFQGAMGAFTGAILTLGGLLAAYTIFSGTIGTAHDGEMLGKKYSSVWVPIRFSLAALLIIPGSNGYTAIQNMVMWLTLQGVSIANSVWNATVDNMFQSNKISIVNQVNQPEKIHTLAYQIYLTQLCVAANERSVLENRAKHAEYQLNIDQTFETEYYGQTDNRDKNRYEYGNTILLFGKDSCGSISYPVDTVANITSSTTSNKGINLNLRFNFTNLGSISSAQKSALDTLIEGTKTIAEKVVADANPGVSQADISAQLRTLGDSYYNSMLEQVRNLVSGEQIQQIKSEMKSAGWIMAGASYTRIILLQNEISNMTKFFPSVSFKLSEDNISRSDDVKKYFKNGVEALGQSEKSLLKTTDGCTAVNASECKSVSNESIFSIGGFVTKLTGVDMRFVENETRHPILIMSSIGNNLIDSFWTALKWVSVVGMGVGVVARILDIGTAGSATAVMATLAMTSMMVLIVPLITYIFTAGVLAFILPNLPFLMWLGVIIGWTVLVVEAIIVAPIWIAMKINPNGEDIVGRGGNGYSYLLSLVLKPVLTIFGLVAAITLTDLFGNLINKIIFSVFSLNTNTNKMGIFEFVFFFLVYTILMYKVMLQGFSLMHQIPDHILKWVGGRTGSDLGGLSKSTGMAAMAGSSGIISNQIASTATKVSQQGLNTMDGFMRQAQNSRQIKAQKEVSKAQAIEASMANALPKLKEELKDNIHKASNNFTDMDGNFSNALDENIRNNLNSSSLDPASLDSGNSKTAENIYDKTASFLSSPNISEEHLKVYQESLNKYLTEDKLTFSESHKKAFEDVLDKKDVNGNSLLDVEMEKDIPEFKNLVTSLTKNGMNLDEAYGFIDTASKTLRQQNSFDKTRDLASMIENIAKQKKSDKTEAIDSIANKVLMSKNIELKLADVKSLNPQSEKLKSFVEDLHNKYKNKFNETSIENIMAEALKNDAIRKDLGLSIFDKNKGLSDIVKSTIVSSKNPMETIKAISQINNNKFYKNSDNVENMNNILFALQKNNPNLIGNINGGLMESIESNVNLLNNILNINPDTAEGSIKADSILSEYIKNMSNMIESHPGLSFEIASQSVLNEIVGSDVGIQNQINSFSSKLQETYNTLNQETNNIESLSVISQISQKVEQTFIESRIEQAKIEFLTEEQKINGSSYDETKSIKVFESIKMPEITQEIKSSVEYKTELSSRVDLVLSEAMEDFNSQEILSKDFKPFKEILLNV